MIFGKSPKVAEKRLVVVETANSVWSYHLRLVAVGDEKYGGGAGLSLCGNKMGWDTKIPLSAYGVASHIPSHYCLECNKLAKANKYLGHEELYS